MGDGTMLQIGDVADEVGLSLRTIRHYEEVGLVRPSERSTGGFRLYNQADIDRLRLVKRLKPLDFSLDEMRDLLETLDRLALHGDDPARRQLLERLSLFTTIAQERCDRLQEQLENAQALTVHLRRVVVDAHQGQTRTG